jgi:3-hydroxyacyl-CoA dehydrogenase
MEIEGQKRNPLSGWPDMLEARHESFYKIENGKRHYYDIPTSHTRVIPGTGRLLF